EVAVGEEDVVDLQDLLEPQHGGDRAAVHAQLPVHEKTRRAVLGQLTAVAAEDAQVHQVSPNRSFISRNSRYFCILARSGTTTPSGWSRTMRALAIWSSACCTASTERPMRPCRSAAFREMSFPCGVSRPRFAEERRKWTTRLAGSLSSRFSICSSASCRRSESFLIRRTAISTLPRIIASKVRGSMTRSLPCSAITAPAERGLLFRIAISPKNSPAPRVARIFSVSRTFLVMFTLPDWTTNISRPGSPSRN